MKIRCHRGSIEESLATEEEIPNSKQDVVNYLSNYYPDMELTQNSLAISYYCVDKRTKEDVYLISVYYQGAYYPLAFTNQVVI